MKHMLLLILASFCCVWTSAPERSMYMEGNTNVIVFREAGRFAGWPANNGIWCWGKEIVVGFTLGYHLENESGHPIDGNRTQAPRLARSTDGGLTWKTEVPSFLDEHDKEKPLVLCPGGIDFSHPDFAMMIRMQKGNSGLSYFYWSQDRCKNWHGPYALPTFDRKGMISRTDYIVNGPHDMTACLTAPKADGNEGWPMCVRTMDGGKSWKQLSWIGKEPGKGDYAIMPTTVRFSPSELLTYIRCRGSENGQRKWWIEPYRSLDNGLSWTLEKHNSIDNAGNPAHMIKLQDGRVALTYGFRRAPYGIRAKLSEDKGKTWSDEIVLRNDGDNWDLGYPRTIQRDDGKLVTVYYFNDSTSKYRYIAGTIWDASKSLIK